MNRTKKNFFPRSDKMKLKARIFKNKRLFEAYHQGYQDCLGGIQNAFCTKLNSDDQAVFFRDFDKTLKNAIVGERDMRRYKKEL